VRKKYPAITGKLVCAFQCSIALPQGGGKVLGFTKGFICKESKAGSLALLKSLEFRD
jgi:hypothetical protein